MPIFTIINLFVDLIKLSQRIFYQIILQVQNLVILLATEQKIVKITI